MIKKIITISFLSIFILGFATPITYGVSYDKDMPGWQDEQENENNTNQDADQMSGGITITASQVPNIIEKISLWLYRLVMVLSVGFIILSAFYFLRGGDNPIYVKKAKSQLVYAIIGIIIALASFGIGKFIENIIRSGS
jgi:hypothetical protein